MPEAHGVLVPADETLNHQIVDTFGTVGHSDPSRTEKAWTIAHARDGSLQLVFGIGEYTDRGVFDGAAGVARGTEQWTVRGSRTLAHDPAGLGVGPWRYEIVEPLRAVRCVLEPNPHALVAFDASLRGAFAPSLEDPWPDRIADGFRLAHQVLRLPPAGRGLFADAGIPAAEPAISEPDGAWLGPPFPGMPHVAGEIPGDFAYPFGGWFHDGGEELQRRCYDTFVDTLIALHTLPVTAAATEVLLRQLGRDSDMDRRILACEPLPRWTVARIRSE